MYTVFSIYFETIQHYFAQLNVVQKLKYTNKVGVTSWQHFGQNKIRTAVFFRRYELYDLILFTHL